MILHVKGLSVGKPFPDAFTVSQNRDMFEDRLMRNKSNRYKWEDQVCEGITIADLEEQRIRGGVRLGVERGRMPESSLLETTESLVEKLKLTTIIQAVLLASPSMMTALRLRIRGTFQMS